MPAATANPAPAPTRPRPSNPGTRRVIVADDHPVFRDGIVRALLATGRYEIAGEAGDGETALDLILRHRPGVALVDLRMPRLDGFGLLRRIKGERLSVSLVLLSAFTQPKIVEQALAAGAAAYLSKDASREQIIAGVDAAASAARVLQPLAPLSPHNDRAPTHEQPGLAERRACRAPSIKHPDWAEALTDSQRRAAIGRAHAQQRLAEARQHALVSIWLRELIRG